MKNKACFTRFLLVLASAGCVAACTPKTPQVLTTMADARIDKAKYIDIGEAGDSVGDILVFDQPLLNEQEKSIGTNSGICVRTRVNHSFQCQWTLTFQNGSIQVAGREFDKGVSKITIIGGTGVYAGIRGEMDSVNNNNGTFTQILRYWTK